MSTTKTEQKLRRPGLPQSVIYKNLKQQIVNLIQQSGLPAWCLADMLTNITLSVQNAGEQQTSTELTNYNKQLEEYNGQRNEGEK